MTSNHNPVLHKSKAAVLARLAPYWKIEAANIVGLPFVIVVLSRGKIGWVTLVPMLAMVLLLAIGAVYWRMKVQQLRGEPHDTEPVLQRIASLRKPTLALTLIGCVVAALGWFEPTWTRGLSDRFAATGCAVLAALEYVNYYHRQLQHFDNLADFRRLLAGKGFRRSWLARDLAAMSKGRQSPHQQD